MTLKIPVEVLDAVEKEFEEERRRQKFRLGESPTGKRFRHLIEMRQTVEGLVARPDLIEDDYMESTLQLLLLMRIAEGLESLGAKKEET